MTSCLLAGLIRLNLRPDSTFCSMVIAGNGFGRWKTIPMLRRTSVARCDGS